MPSKSRQKPARLAVKLSKIREELGLSQSEMVKRLNAEDQIDRAKISEFQSGLLTIRPFCVSGQCHCATPKCRFW